MKKIFLFGVLVLFLISFVSVASITGSTIDDGTKPIGSFCWENSQCESGYCFFHTPLAETGKCACQIDDDCFEGCSGYKTSPNQCSDGECLYVDTQICDKEKCNAPCEVEDDCPQPDCVGCYAYCDTQTCTCKELGPECRDENYKCTIEDIPCCEGLKEVGLCFPDENGQCICASCGSICRPCGNGICDENENICNCPEDCSAENNYEEEFCGTSSYDYCESDNDCITGGCSGEVCQNKIEEGLSTNCVWRDCYDDEKYNKGCMCVNNKCQWISKVKETITQVQTQKIIQSQNKLKIQPQTQECPEDCICTGSSTKCQLQNGGREMTITAGKSGNTIVQVKGVDMSTKVVLYKLEGEIYGVFRNNQTKIINIMPDEVKEKIRQRTKAKIQDEEIELDEDGVYQVRAKKKARLFFIFPIKEKVKIQLNSETGEIIRIRNSWWGFLARDVEETSEELEQEIDEQSSVDEIVENMGNILITSKEEARQFILDLAQSNEDFSQYKDGKFEILKADVEKYDWNALTTEGMTCSVIFDKEGNLFRDIPVCAAAS